MNKSTLKCFSWSHVESGSLSQFVNGLQCTMYVCVCEVMSRCVRFQIRTQFLDTPQTLTTKSLMKLVILPSSHVSIDVDFLPLPWNLKKRFLLKGYCEYIIRLRYSRINIDSAHIAKGII